ncbi:MAG: MerR family transcriptional regulator [Myxococcales bacterium]|nr:MerR family transcriptional regulator [Myxococcales bacterium]
MSTTRGYRIKTVAKLTGVPRNTLLAWERRYGFVVPDRTDNGYRVYSDEDVARLRAIKSLVDGGHAVSEAIAMLDGQERRRGSVPPGPGPGQFEEHRSVLLAALLAYDRAGADIVVTRLADEPFSEVLNHVYFPMLRDLGVGWSNGTYTVAQEHFATAYIRERLTRMLLRLGCGPESGPRVVLACYPTEPHELGLLGLAIRFALAGWRAVFLGARMPEADLVDFLQGHPPKLLCVSVVLPVEVDDLSGYATRVRSALPPSIGVAVGGSGLPNGLPSIEGVHLGSSFTKLMTQLEI